MDAGIEARNVATARQDTDVHISPPCRGVYRLQAVRSMGRYRPWSEGVKTRKAAAVPKSFSCGKLHGMG